MNYTKCLLFLTVILIKMCYLCYAANRYFTLEDCYRDVSSGTPCNAVFRVYHWNNELQACEKTTYGGCKPTANNFNTLRSCEQIAKNLCAKK